MESGIQKNDQPPDILIAATAYLAAALSLYFSGNGAWVVVALIGFSAAMMPWRVRSGQSITSGHQLFLVAFFTTAATSFLLVAAAWWNAYSHNPAMVSRFVPSMILLWGVRDVSLSVALPGLVIGGYCGCLFSELRRNPLLWCGLCLFFLNWLCFSCV